jgi:hypothetical protein
MVNKMLLHKQKWKNELEQERLYVLCKINEIFKIVNKKNNKGLFCLLHDTRKKLFYLEKELREWKK